VPQNRNDYDAILLDLDGTLYYEEHPLPGAVELLRRLQRDHRTFACLSNSTSSPHLIGQRLQRMGVTVPEQAIFTAGAAAVDYVLKHWTSGAMPRVYNLATDGVHEMLDGKVHWVSSASEPCDAVLVGTPGSAFAALDRQRTALHVLRADRRAKLIGICADRVFPSQHGIEFGTGALTAMLAYAANVTPIFTGKPEPIFFHELCQRLGVAPARCLLIGDNLESDIAGGKAVGMRTILTLTGVTQRGDLEALPPERRPGGVIEDLRELNR
jgi:HAD superfamily hydrolase (TIGR01450 family)